MSYQTMDHARWVEESIAAVKRRPMTARDKRNTAAGRGWFAAPDKLSDDQARMFDILGMVGNGIYNAPISWHTLDWHCGSGIAVVWHGDLASFDYYQLTMLTFLCHEARIRCDISAQARGYLRIMLHPRAAEGGMARRHPNLDEALAAFRAYLPPDHRIFHRPAPAATESEAAHG